LIVAQGNDGDGGVDVQEITLPFKVTVLPSYKVYAFKVADGLELPD